MRYDLYPYKTDELYISLSRGCFHRCAFCVQSDDFPNPYRKMDIDNIKDKIVRATEYFPIKRLLFSDPIFGIDMKGTEQLVEFLSNKYPHYTYWAETRIDRTTEDLIKCLSKLKIDLHFGVESLAEDTLLNLMTKTKNAEQYNEAFFKTIEYCQKYNVLGLFGFIMNYPGEKAESSRYTMQQLKKVTFLYDKLNVTFHINPYALYPGNEIYNRRFELAESRGFTTKEIFKRMSEYSFIQEMNSSANVCTKIIFKKPRIIRYGIEVKNVGYWESERVFIPEKNVIITQRKEPMGPFKYLVVIYVLEKDNQGTKFTYIEEFDVCDNYQNEVEKIYSDISKKVNPILQKITDYFNSEHILQ